MKKQLRAWRNTALLALAATVCVAWIVFDNLFSPFGTPSVTLEIPRLCGRMLNEDEIDDRIDLQTEYRYDDQAPEGIVLTQTPTAGSRRKLTAQNPRCTVKVTVSLGKESLPLPDTVGKDARESTAALRKQGFAVKTVLQESEQAEGTVISTQPRAGTKLPKGAEVTLTVSAGIKTKTVTVPDLIGLGRSEALVKLWLAQLSVAEVIEIDADAPANCVVRQSIPKGTTVTTGTAVTLFVSREFYEDETTWKGVNTNT